MFFFTTRIISILLLLIAIPHYEENYITILYYTSLQFFVCVISLYGAYISDLEKQKVWTWIFGATAFLNIFLYRSAQGISLYIIFFTIIVFIISFFFIGKEKNEQVSFVINKAFYLFLILLFILILFISGSRYRWERVEYLNFNIDNHQYVIEGEFYSYCDDLKDCGWKYYRDRFTGLTKAEQDEYDPILLIYEQPYMRTIDNFIDTFTILLILATVWSMYYSDRLSKKTKQSLSNDVSNSDE